MKKKSLNFWIKEHQKAIDAFIDKTMGYRHCDFSYSKIDDNSRRWWILTHEVLYGWARSEGVSI